MIEDKMKACRECGERKPMTDFHVNRAHSTGRQVVCKPCARIRNLRYRAAHPERYANNMKWSKNRRRYGVDEGAYNTMLADQNGHCAMYPCGDKKPLHIDHDHATGATRGLLCGECNLGLGKFGDDPERLRRAADYLERYQ